MEHEMATTELKQRFLRAGPNPFQVWREKHGLTRTEFARLLDVRYGVIYELEKGHYGPRLPDHLVHQMLKAHLPIETLIPAYLRWRRGEPWQNDGGEAKEKPSQKPKG